MRKPDQRPSAPEPLLGEKGRSWAEALAAWKLHRFLFDDEGRIGRRALWFYLAAVMALAFVVFFNRTLRQNPMVHLGVGLVLLYPSYCVFAKRLQDFNIPGGWAALITLVSAADIVLAASGLKLRPGRFASAISVWEWVGIANMLFLFLVLGGWRGSPGANRFGLRWPPW